jgi:hypothetical protein
LNLICTVTIDLSLLDLDMEWPLWDRHASHRRTLQVEPPHERFGWVDLPFILLDGDEMANRFEQSGVTGAPVDPEILCRVGVRRATGALP